LLADMKTFLLSLTLLVAIPARAQLLTASAEAAGLDPARLEVTNFGLRFSDFRFLRHDPSGLGGHNARN